MKRIKVTVLVVMIIFCFTSISFAVDLNDEIVSMRTKYAKTYENKDGSYTTKVYLKPIHKQDELGNWVDINLNEKSSTLYKKANYDSLRISPPYDAWKYNTNFGFSDGQGGDYYGNIVGYLYEEQQARTYRQMFRWDLQDIFSGTITISAMKYNFNNLGSLTTPNDTMDIAPVYDDPGDPEYPSTAQEVWYNDTEQPFTDVVITPNGNPKKYEVNLYDDRYTLQYRINNENEKWYALHHKMETEGSSHGFDICADPIGGEDLGCLIITWTSGGGKIAARNDYHVTVSPNPFNPQTSITFTLNESSNVILDVYSLNGQKVITLVNGYVNAGVHSYVFDGKNLATGVYFYRLSSQGFTKTGKMLFMK